MPKACLKNMQIADVHIDNPVFLAPMAGYTNLPFRLLARSFGAGAVFSEMVSAKGLYYRDKKTANLMQTLEEEAPAGVQIFGSDPSVIETVVEKYINPTPFAFLDFNAGCPAPKIVKSGDGSALLQNLPLLKEIVSRMVKVSTKPVLIKIRLGWDMNSINVLETAAVIEEAGAAAITIHGRTRSVYYAGKVNWDLIGEVKKHSCIPIILSGDVTSAESARAAFETTGCDALMIGRAAVGNPFIFREITAAIRGRSVPNPPTPAEKIRTALHHVELLERAAYEPAAVQEMRKHMVSYTKGLKNSTELRTRVFQTQTREEMTDLLKTYLWEVYGEEI